MIGKCLCGEVQFELLGEVPNLYECHCLLCRKQSGTSSNTATFIHESNFAWLSGQSNITFFQKETGFTSNFCNKCGSPVPNRLRDTDKFWVPAGLLEATENQKIVADIYTRSKASWERSFSSSDEYSEMPDFESLDILLQRVKD